MSERGFVENLRIVTTPIGCMATGIIWLVLGLVARRTRRANAQPSHDRPQMQSRSELALVAAAIAIAATLLVSPKVGARLYLASTALGAAALGGWMVAQLSGTRTRTVAWVLALACIGYASVACVRAYGEVGPEYEQRFELLSHAPANSVVDLPRYTIKASRWAFDDDLEIPQLRNMVSASFTLALVRMTGTPAGTGSDAP
jgi:hypothetical protein